MEDQAILVINKPPGWSVMGERHGTDLVTIAAQAGEELFPVHRIDKVTSGIVLFAKRLDHHGDLTRQFGKRTVDKQYLAITGAPVATGSGVIDLPLSAGRKATIRVAAPRASITFDEATRSWTVPEADVLTNVRTYPSVTEFDRLWTDEERSVLVARPITGRRHQIRVHLAWTGHPIEGDPLFDKQAKATGKRTCLHSWRLAFDAAWADGARFTVEAAPDRDFWQPVIADLPDPDQLLS